MMMYRLLLLIVAVSMSTVSGAESEYFKFMREVKPAGRQVYDTYTDIVETHTLMECARKCYDDLHCRSFLFDKDEEECQMMDRMHVHFGQDPVEDGGILYDEHDVCEVPKADAVANGLVLFSHGVSEGSRAEYQCDDNYFPTTAYGVCNSTTGTWTGLSCITDPDRKYFIPIRDKFHSGSCVNIIATPTSLYSVVIFFNEVNGNLNFGTEIIFDKNNVTNIFSRNSRLDGGWGMFETGTSTFPFATGQEFDIVICASDTHYTVTTSDDDDELFTYAIRSPLSNLDILEIRGGITARRVRFMY